MLDRYASDLLPDCNSHSVVFLFFWRTISNSFSSCYSHDVWLVYHISSGRMRYFWLKPGLKFLNPRLFVPLLFCRKR